MQPVGDSSVLLLAFGADLKSSLLMSYAREQGYEYLQVKPQESVSQIIERIHKSVKGKRLIIDGLATDVQAIVELQVNLQPEKVKVVYFNRKEPPTEPEQQVISYFERHGKLKRVDLVPSLEESYRNLRRSLLQRVIFVYGPPLEIKSQLAKQLAAAVGYQYVDYQHLRNNVLEEKDGVVFVNKFIRWCIQSGKNIVLDGFVQRKAELTVLEEYLLPKKVVHIQPTKDQVESRLKAITKPELRRAKLKEFEQYIQLEKELLEVLARRPYYQKVTLESDDEAAISKMIRTIQPQTVYLNSTNQEFIKSFTEKFKAVHLNPLELMKSEYERQTGLAQAHLVQSAALSYDVLVGYLKKIVYNLDSNIVVTGLPSNVMAFAMFEQLVAPILKYVMANGEYNPEYSEELTPELYYLQQQKLIVLESAAPSPQYLLSLLKNQPHFVVINGPQTSGKTSLAKVIAREYGYKHYEFEPYVASIKEKLITAEDGEELPAKKVIQHFKELAKKERILVDCLPYEGKDLELFISEVGNPLIINIKADPKNLVKRDRKKNGADVNAEIPEEEMQKAEAAIEKNNGWLRSAEEVLERHPHLRLFQVDFNGNLLTSESLLPVILKPRVFLVGRHDNNLLFLNIALKYRMDYIDLQSRNLRDIKDSVAKCYQRDIILNNYSVGDSLISDDINWIETNVGVVRYVATWSEQSKFLPSQKMQLERPVVEVKKKPVNEEGEEQQPPPEEDDGEPKKPKFDIYDYEWSQTGSPLNLSQWFLACRHPCTEVTSCLIQLLNESANLSAIYEQFERVIRDLNNNKDMSYYQLIK